MPFVFFSGGDFSVKMSFEPDEEELVVLIQLRKGLSERGVYDSFP